jgi:predicted MFS family arabinose efflux permease
MPKPKLFSRSLIIASVSFLFFAISFFLIIVIISAYAMDKFKVSAAEGGLAISIFVAGSLASRFIFARWIEKSGQKAMLLLGLFFCLAITLLYFVASNIYFLYGVRFFHGAAFGVVTSTIATIASNLIPRERRGEGLGYFNLGPTLGNAVGPFLGMFIYQHADYNMVFGVSAITASISLLLVIFISVPETKLTLKQTSELKGLSLRNFLEPKALPISIFMASLIFSYSVVVAFLTPYAREINLLDSATFFFIVYSVVVLLSRPLVGRLYDLKGANIIIYPAVILFSASMLMVSQSYFGYVLLFSAALLGLSTGSITTLAQTIAVQTSPQHRLGLANSTYFIFYDIGVAVGPFLFGILLPLTGYREMFAFCALFSLASILLYYYLYGKKAASIKPVLNQ